MKKLIYIMGIAVLFFGFFHLFISLIIKGILYLRALDGSIYRSSQ